MKKFSFLLIALLPFLNSVYAACGGGQKQVIITIVPDNFPTETSWGLYDAQTNALVDTGTTNSDTVCVSNSQCLKFTMYDTYGDGICCNYGNGSYHVYLDGVLVASGGDFGHSESTTFNCPQGFDCNNPFIATVDTMIAPAPETWYSFTPDSTGIYLIRTCNLGNTCDTKLYVYDHCTGIVIGEGVQGTTFYDDDGCSNYQSLITAALSAGATYYIRVGDYNTACVGHTINWEIFWQGPIVGCMDPNACNYNPLATISDGSCVYPPSPLCPAPDLSVDQNELESSMYVSNITAGASNCYIGEGCLAGYGDRRIIRFSTHIRNIGDMDYYIGSPDTVGNQFVYDACHNHWHYVGYAEYLLYDQNWNQMQAGYKNGFCVLDLECGGGGQAKFGCGNMGITAGCGDIYSAGLDCQWIDITDIDTGVYTLVVRVNWDKSPDKLGHYERTYDNNWAQVCLHLYYDLGGYKVYEIMPQCAVYVDCAGDTLGDAVRDCAGVCNGSNVRGDVDANLSANNADVNLYLDGIKNETLAYTPCIDLNGDSMITVTDAARLNGCLLFTNGQHHHNGNYQNTHKHCEFPFNIYNPNDSVTFTIANVDWQNKYVDISVMNPSCELLAYEFKMHGLVVDSVHNLATGNYSPDIRSASNGHIEGISLDENSLFKQLAPLNFLRVYYSSLTDTMICIEKVIATVNGNYEEVHGKIGGSCAFEPVVQPSAVNETLSGKDLSVIPNPSNGLFDVYLSNQSLYGADIKITDAMGRVVFSMPYHSLSNHFSVDLGSEESGFYFLHISLNGNNLTKRLLLIKQ